MELWLCNLRLQSGVGSCVPMVGVQTGWLIDRRYDYIGQLVCNHFNMVGCNDRNTLHLQIVSDENSAPILVVKTFCYECHSRNSDIGLCYQKGCSCTVSCMPHIGSSILQIDQECSVFYTPLVYVSSMSHVWLQQTSRSSVVVVCPLQPSSCPESSILVSSRWACPISSQVTDHWGELRNRTGEVHPVDPFHSLDILKNHFASVAFCRNSGVYNVKYSVILHVAYCCIDK